MAHKKAAPREHPCNASAQVSRPLPARVWIEDLRATIQPLTEMDRGRRSHPAYSRHLVCCRSGLFSVKGLLDQLPYVIDSAGRTRDAWQRFRKPALPSPADQDEQPPAAA